MTDWLAELFVRLGALWEMSLTGAFAGLVVAALGLVLRPRAPRQILCLLWLVVFARLLLPVTLESPASLVPAQLGDGVEILVQGETEEGPEDPAQTVSQTPDQGQSTLPPTVTVPQIPEGQGQQHAPAELFPWQALAAGLWLAGAAVMGAGGLISYLRLRRRVYDAIHCDDGVWEHPDVRSPFILGMFRPKIYVPAGLTGEARKFVLCHERSHLARWDHVVKPVCWVALAIHWFNPVAWMAFLLMGRDMEVACDQAVVRQLGSGVKQKYSATLLALASGRRFPSPCPVAFGESSARHRIKNVLHYRRPVLWIVIAAAAAAVVAALCLLTDPVATEPQPEGEDPAGSQVEEQASPEPQTETEGPVVTQTEAGIQVEYQGTTQVLSLSLPSSDLETHWMDLDGDGREELSLVTWSELGGGNLYDIAYVYAWQEGEWVLRSTLDFDSYWGEGNLNYPTQDWGTATRQEDGVSLRVSLWGLTTDLPLEEWAWGGTGTLGTQINHSTDASLIWYGGQLYLRCRSGVSTPGEFMPQMVAQYEVLLQLELEEDGTFTAVPLSLTPYCEKICYREIVYELGYQRDAFLEEDMELTFLMPEQGVYLYRYDGQLVLRWEDQITAIDAPETGGGHFVLAGDDQVSLSLSDGRKVVLSRNGPEEWLEASAAGMLAKLTFRLPEGVTAGAYNWFYEKGDRGGYPLLDAQGNACGGVGMYADTAVAFEGDTISHISALWGWDSAALEGLDLTPVAGKIPCVTTLLTTQTFDPDTGAYTGEKDQWCALWSVEGYRPTYALFVDREAMSYEAFLEIVRSAVFAEGAFYADGI